MALTGEYAYTDNDGDIVRIETAVGSDGVAYINTEGAEHGAYVLPKFSVPLALNVLGYDRPEDGPSAPTSYSVNDVDAFVATDRPARDRQVSYAAALLMAADAYDQREKRLETAQQRREAAAVRLSDSVAAINSLAITSKTFGNNEIGKLREALGRYDAELAN